MASAEFDRVAKRFGDVVAVDDFSLRVRDGELVAVVGPSGCGKSTVLRLTAGLETLNGGEIRLDGRRIDGLPPDRRDVAMVFQSYALYPHMTVRGNIEFPLRMRRVTQKERRRQVETAAALLELTDLLDRRPAQLSGGQRQRVALARALVRQPQLFLLDEPLSNLDAPLRLSVRRYLRDVQQRTGVTTLYVTHDQGEAMTLGDRVVIMQQSRIQQVDTPVDVYERPANVFVAGFIGTPPMNLLSAAYDDRTVRIGGQTLTAPPELRVRLAARRGPFTCGIRPEAFTANDGQTGDIVAKTTSGTIEIMGSATLVRGTIGNVEITASLAGVVRAAPSRVSAPLACAHWFGADGQRIE